MAVKPVRGINARGYLYSLPSIDTFIIIIVFLVKKSNHDAKMRSFSLQVYRCSNALFGSISSSRIIAIIVPYFHKIIHKVQ